MQPAAMRWYPRVPNRPPLTKEPDRVSERSPRDGLSICAQLPK